MTFTPKFDSCEYARNKLRRAGFHDLAAVIDGDCNLIVRPARALTWPEAEAFVKIRRDAYLAVGMIPCQCGPDSPDCKVFPGDPVPPCFTDNDAWQADQIERLQHPTRR